MGVDIRKVPLTWKHPCDEQGEYIQISRSTYEDEMENFHNTPEDFDGVPPQPEECFPSLKEGEPFGFMFYSGISDTPYSDTIFTNWRDMAAWWMYASRALTASSVNYEGQHYPDTFVLQMALRFRRDVGEMVDPSVTFTAEDTPRSIVLSADERKVYAAARAKYREGHTSDETLDAMFEMFDEWLS